jgi:hypothetical protein
MYSHNIVVPSTEFKVTGTPKEFTVTAASGKSITNCFCGDCGKYKKIRINDRLKLTAVLFQM